jgi:glycosyltransferase involved in cell wall biosynthesis
MRIAQVSPLFESVPPKLYGGTERVVSYLTEELVRRGHDVTLFASGDSTTRGRLVPVSPRSLRLNPECRDPLAHHVLALEHVRRLAHEFDIIHFHIDYLHFPLSRAVRWPHVTTLHGRLDLEDLQPLYAMFGDMPLVSISDAQRRPIAKANWVGTVHHGLPPDLLRFRGRPGRYLAFLGRLSPEKRPDRAIEIAKSLGLPLKIAAKIEEADRRYFDEHIRHLLDSPLVEFVGEISEAQKEEFLADAIALLFPIDWAEPFGLVMIEAMACGTPVVAWKGGSVEEVIDDGVTGFVVESIPDAIDAVLRAAVLDRAQCRAVFERRFVTERMTREYEALYAKLLRKRRTPARGTMAAKAG